MTKGPGQHRRGREGRGGGRDGGSQVTDVRRLGKQGQGKETGTVTGRDGERTGKRWGKGGEKVGKGKTLSLVRSSNNLNTPCDM